MMMMMPSTVDDTGVNFDFAAIDKFFHGTVSDASLIDPSLGAFMGAGSAVEPPVGGQSVQPDSLILPAGGMSASNNTVSPSKLSHEQGTSNYSDTQQSGPDSGRGLNVQGNIPQGLQHFVQSNHPPSVLNPGSVLPAPTPYLIQHPQQQHSTGHSTLLEPSLRDSQPASGLPPNNFSVPQQRQQPRPQRQGIDPYDTSQSRYSSLAWCPDPAAASRRLNNAQDAVTGFPPPLSSDNRQQTTGPNYPLCPPYGRPIASPSGGPISFYPPPSYAGKQIPPYGNPGLGPSPIGYFPAPGPTSNASKGEKASNGFDEDTTAVPAEKNAATVIKSPSLYLDLDNSKNSSTPAVNGPDMAQIWAKTDKHEPSFAVSDEMENSRVMSARAAKKKNTMHKADPSKVYKEHEGLPKSKPFGPRTVDGRYLFTYTKDGQLAEDRVYSRDELQIYLDDHRSVLWIQQSPSQCASRLHYDDRRCRWDKCPLASRVIGSGWFRVAFDEHPHLTTKGGKDPFKVAGIMHLWCFEQCFDIVDFFIHNRVRPDTRILPRETGNAMSINRDSDREIVKEAFDPWFKERQEYRSMYGLEKLPRQHQDTLSFRLSRHHVDSQTGARQKARDSRNDGKPWKERTTIDVHMGDLQVYITHSNHKKNAKRKKNRVSGTGASARRRNSSFVAEMVNDSFPVTGTESMSGGFGLMNGYASLPQPSEILAPQLGMNVPQPDDDDPHAAPQELHMMSNKDGHENNAFFDFVPQQPWQPYNFDETDNTFMAFEDPALGQASLTATASQGLDQTSGDGRGSSNAILMQTAVANNAKQTPAGATSTTSQVVGSNRGHTDDDGFAEEEQRSRGRTRPGEGSLKRKRDETLVEAGVGR
ncbi:hypothetical protein CP533_4239 [Ophiocordyceps camponoti-saundersi (nom. inval.)]|nr:hypothetical protein CP533_4239 [Ophiocordyceps camponoti-saundersi (nom. inval.)]